MTSIDPTAPLPAVLPFPKPDPIVQLAYDDLNLAVGGKPKDLERLGDLTVLPRPWMPESCTNPPLRQAIWRWLEQVVNWLNHEYAWRGQFAIPGCWASHPHLVHELAVVADLRRRAGLSLTSDALEEWHRYVLTGFRGRLQEQIHQNCDPDHDDWPARSRFTEAASGKSHDVSKASWERDIRWALAELQRVIDADPGPRPLRVVKDPDTGERVDKVTGEVL